MAERDGNAFRLIEVHDDEEELVIRAGSGVQAAPGEHQAPEVVAAETPDAPETSPLSPHAQELRRRAEELAQAEAGLEDPHAHASMRRYVLIALVVLVLAVVVYSVAIHA